MKGIVLEKNKNRVIILTKEGDMKKTTYYKDTEVGKEINISGFNNTRIYSSLAAAFLLCIFSIAFYMTNFTPFGYVYVDINPSIKISYNRFNKVIDVDPLNDDGVNIVNNINNKGINIDEAIKSVIHEANKQEYLNEDKENYVLLTFATKESDKENVIKIEKEVTLLNEEIELDINWAFVETDISEYNPEYKESLGKKILNKDADESSEKKSVKELVESSNEEEGSKYKLKVLNNLEKKIEKEQRKNIKKTDKIDEKSVKKNNDIGNDDNNIEKEEKNVKDKDKNKNKQTIDSNSSNNNKDKQKNINTNIQQEDVNKEVEKEYNNKNHKNTNSNKDKDYKDNNGNGSNKNNNGNNDVKNSESNERKENKNNKNNKNEGKNNEKD